jgi:hypothetical protein
MYDETELGSFVNELRPELLVFEQPTELEPTRIRELLLLNILGRVAADDAAADEVRDFVDATRAEAGGPLSSGDDMSVEFSLIAKQYSENIRDLVETVTAPIDPSRTGTLLRNATWVLCQEAYARSLMYEPLFEKIGYDPSEAINELHDNDWHIPTRMVRHMEVVLTQRRSDNEASLHQAIAQRSVLMTRLQLADEEIFIKAKLQEKLAPQPETSALGKLQRFVLSLVA